MYRCCTGEGHPPLMVLPFPHPLQVRCPAVCIATPPIVVRRAVATRGVRSSSPVPASNCAAPPLHRRSPSHYLSPRDARTPHARPNRHHQQHSAAIALPRCCATCDTSTPHSPRTPICPVMSRSFSPSLSLHV